MMTTELRRQFADRLVHHAREVDATWTDMQRLAGIASVNPDAAARLKMLKTRHAQLDAALTLMMTAASLPPSQLDEVLERVHRDRVRKLLSLMPRVRSTRMEAAR